MTKAFGPAYVHVRDDDIVVARDSAVPIMDDMPHVVGLLLNLYYHRFLCK